MIEEITIDMENNNHKEEEMEKLFNYSESLLNIYNSKTQEEIIGLAAIMK